MGRGAGPIVALLIQVIVEAAFIAIQIARNKAKADEEARNLNQSAQDNGATQRHLVTTKAGQDQVFKQLAEMANASLNAITLSILQIDYDAKVELAGNTGHVAETGATGIVGAITNVLPKKKWRDGEARPKPDEFTFYDYIDYYVWRYWYDYYERFEENGFGTEPNKEETKKDVIDLEKKILNNIADIYDMCSYDWDKSEFVFANVYEARPKPSNMSAFHYRDDLPYGSGLDTGRNPQPFFKENIIYRYESDMDIVARSKFYQKIKSERNTTPYKFGLRTEDGFASAIPPGFLTFDLVRNPMGEGDLWIRKLVCKYATQEDQRQHYPFREQPDGQKWGGEDSAYNANGGGGGYALAERNFVKKITHFNPGATYRNFWKHDESDQGYWANIYALRVMVNALIVEAISNARWNKSAGSAYLVSDYAKKTLWETVGDKPKVYGTIQNNYTEDLFYKTYLARKMLEALVDLGQLQAVDTAKNVETLSDKLWRIDPKYTDKIRPATGVAPGQTGISRETELAAGECWKKAGQMVQDIYKEEIKLACEEWKAKNYELTDHSVVIRKLTHHFTPPTVDEPKPPQDPSPTKPGDKNPTKPSDRPLVPTQEQIEEEAPAQVGEAPKPTQDTSVIKHIRQATVNQAKAAPITERQKRLNAISERFRNKLSGSGIEMSAQEQADAEREDKNHDGLDTFAEEDEDADIAPEADAEDEEEVAAQTAVLDTSIKKAVKQQVSTQVKSPPLSEKQKRINAIAARFKEKK